MNQLNIVTVETVITKINSSHEVYRTFRPGSDSARKNMDVSAKSMDVSAKEYRRFGQRRWTFRPEKVDVSARKNGHFGQIYI